MPQLKVEQLALDVEPATIAAQRAARCDHPVAGNDNSDWIPVVRHAYGTVGVCVANGLSNVAVAAGLAVRDFEQCAPARELELGSAKVERERELSALARKVFLELAQIRREGWLRFLELSRPGIYLQHAGFEFQSHQALRGSGKEEWADRRRRADVEQSFHDALQDSTMPEASVGLCSRTLTKLRLVPDRRQTASDEQIPAL
jgi:hypothetical protein